MADPAGDAIFALGARDCFLDLFFNCILIGRGAMQNPWIFRQFQDALEGHEPYQPDLKEKKDVLLEFFGMCREEMPELAALGKMNLFALAFRVNNMKTPAGRARKIAAIVDMLARGDTPVTQAAGK